MRNVISNKSSEGFDHLLRTFISGLQHACALRRHELLPLPSSEPRSTLGLCQSRDTKLRGFGASCIRRIWQTRGGAGTAYFSGGIGGYSAALVGTEYGVLTGRQVESDRVDGSLGWANDATNMLKVSLLKKYTMLR